MWLKISGSSVEPGSREDSWVCSESVFVNDFWFCSSLCAMKISACAIELCTGEDLWVCNESVSVNYFWFCSSLCGLRISASAVELCSREDFWVCSESVFVNYFWFCSSLYGWRFKLQPLNRVLVRISGSAGNHFSSMIFDSTVVYAPWRIQRQP